MSSGFSTLSTKLSLQASSSSAEDESKRFHKVSLISGSLDAAPEINGGEYKWKNRFEGVCQYKPLRGEDSSLSDSSQATCKYLDTSSSVSSLALEPNITPGNRQSGGADTHMSGLGEQSGDWWRSSSEWEEPGAPVEGEGVALRLKSLGQRSAYDSTLKEAEDDSERFTGVFQAKLVELDSDPVGPTPSTPPASPDSDSPSQFDMDNLVDTLKSMGPSIRPRAPVPRPPAPVLMSSLPPIVEDTHSPASVDVPDIAGAANLRGSLERKPAETLNGLYALPPDLGLRSSRDTRTPLDLMKQSQQVHTLFYRYNLTHTVEMMEFHHHFLGGKRLLWVTTPSAASVEHQQEPLKI